MGFRWDLLVRFRAIARRSLTLPGGCDHFVGRRSQSVRWNSGADVPLRLHGRRGLHFCSAWDLGIDAAHPGGHVMSRVARLVKRLQRTTYDNIHSELNQTARHRPGS